MKTILESGKLSLSECKRILNRNGNNYTDEEIMIIRNWLYKVSEMTLNFLERKNEQEILELKKLFNKKNENTTD